MPRVIAPSPSPSCTQTRRDSIALDLLPDDLDNEGEGQIGESAKVCIRMCFILTREKNLCFRPSTQDYHQKHMQRVR